MTEPQADNQKSLRIKISDYITTRRADLIGAQNITESDLERLATDIRSIATTSETPAGETGGTSQGEEVPPNLSDMAAGLALGLCKSKAFTGKNSFRFLDVLEKSLKKTDGQPEIAVLEESKPSPDKTKFQKISLKDLILALLGTRDDKVLEEYLPLLAMYRSKAAREGKKFIEFDSKKTNQLLLGNFFTDNPAMSGKWILKARILQKSFVPPAGISENPQKKKGKSDNAHATMPDEFTTWASTWALALQSTLAGALAAGLGSSPDLVEVVVEVRSELEKLSRPHGWIREIMKPWLETAGGTATGQGIRRKEVCEALQGLRGDYGTLKTSIESAMAQFVDQVEKFIGKDQEFRDDHEKYKESFNQDKVDDADKLKREIEYLNGNLERLSEDNTFLSHRLTDFQNQNQGLLSQVSSLEGRIQFCQDSIQRYIVEQERLGGRIIELERDVATERNSADSRVRHEINKIPELIQQRVVDAKEEIRAEIKSDLNALEEGFATKDKDDPLRRMWSVFSANIRRILNIQ